MCLERSAGEDGEGRVARSEEFRDPQERCGTVTARIEFIAIVVQGEVEKRGGGLREAVGERTQPARDFAAHRGGW